MKHFTVTLAFSLLVLIGCAPTVENKEDLVDNQVQNDIFWTWFQDHSDELYEFENNQDQLFDQLTAELNKIDENLTFVFGGSQDDDTRDFIISAGGITSSFDAVENLCNVAPNMKSWVIIAFRPRIGADLRIMFDTIEMDGQLMKFTYKPAGDVVDIKLFVPNYDSSDDRYISAAFIMLDNALGEYDVETKIGEIEFLSVPNDTTNLLSFSEIPNVVDNYK